MTYIYINILLTNVCANKLLLFKLRNFYKEIKYIQIYLRRRTSFLILFKRQNHLKFDIKL